jgi:branched-chain amino acid transport system substrate-binding protein
MDPRGGQQVGARSARRSAGPARRLLADALVVLVLAAGLAAVLASGGCSTGKAQRPGLTEDAQVRADRIFAQLRQESDLHRDRRVLELAFELIDHYQAYPANDEALLMATRSAARLHEIATGRRLVREFLGRHADSPLAAEVLALGSELAATDGDTLAAADLALRRQGMLEGALARREAADQAAVYLERLPAVELAQLAGRHPESSLRPFIGFLRVQRLIAAQQTAEAEQLVAEMRRDAPQSDWVSAAEKLLTEPGYRPAEQVPTAPAGPVVSTRVGLLCPLSGRYAVLGNAFYDGALQALADVNASSRQQFELIASDTEGDPVGAALAARQLIGEQQVIGLVGALLSAPTAAAALVADHLGVPLISPTATNERIGELGQAIFQGKQTALFEARLLAEVATRVLLKERIAVLYPSSHEGDRTFQIFSEEVVSRGGQIVAAVPFSPEDTDFRQPLQEIRRQRPEVVYVDATTDQMVLLVPQLDFYRVGALIMGPSSWNSPQLVSLAGAGLLRVVFPDDMLLYPASWEDDFRAGWQQELMPEEATSLALRSYLATRLLLDTLARDQIERPDGLASALAARLAASQGEESQTATLLGGMRLYEHGEISPFPAGQLMLSLSAADVDTAGIQPLLPGAEAAADSSTGPVPALRQTVPPSDQESP